ncbi:MAG: Hsp20/alpha crystallin family protein [Chloroflexota bacterium]
MYRRYSIRPAWREMDRLQREMNRLFDTYTPTRMRTAAGYPAMNIWANEDGLSLTAEVPGVRSDDIEINVVGETLTLTGERVPDELKEGARYHRQERGYGRFTRSIQLPFPVDVNKVEATFRNGILNVNLPRAEQDKPKKIAVKSL